MADLPSLPHDLQEAALNGPALAPPAGVTPNFDNPPNSNGLAYGVIAACVSVATICLLIRGYARLFLFRQLKPEDYMIVFAYGTFICWTVFSLLLSKTPGFFVHQWNLHLRAMIDTVFYIHYAGVFYSITLPLLKIAILTEWTRMLVPRGTRNVFWWFCNGVIASQVMAMIAIVFALCFVCIPYQKIWDLTLPGHCINKLHIDIGAATVHLTTDLVILCLPQKVIWGLQLSLRKKLGVSIFFSLGILACISAAFRLGVTVTYATDPDTTYTFGPVIFWAFAEMTCGFIIACLPSTPKILKDHGILHKMKRMAKSFVGMKNSTLRSTKPTTGTGTNPNSTYRKIDEYGVQMKDLKNSESTEQLRDDSIKFDQGIVRTTRVTIKQEYVGDVGKNAVDHNAAWRN
ncbi:uncharacterized protein F4807DRAFT_212163 [Annulohypoxylon truncatum]|uniref:uncharacterized protein n=1 Tax=Annulohypoxylon truncatum TaxID=327061 RepID=UPI0020084E0C|nr:uncharacterized protein F4807DRAFT_212163 [Annulohypoxylon truncatum]KAI1207046.1 hypothetical protein F4807DRAFT_212163 [Annulohypoxylon truncatum]